MLKVLSSSDQAAKMFWQLVWNKKEQPPKIKWNHSALVVSEFTHNPSRYTHTRARTHTHREGLIFFQQGYTSLKNHKSNSPLIQCIIDPYGPSLPILSFKNSLNFDSSPNLLNQDKFSGIFSILEYFFFRLRSRACLIRFMYPALTFSNFFLSLYFHFRLLPFSF